MVFDDRNVKLSLVLKNFEILQVSFYSQDGCQIVVFKANESISGLHYVYIHAFVFNERTKAFFKFLSEKI